MANIIPDATEKWVFCPAVAGASPTRAELNAGLVLINPGVDTAEAGALIDGWTLEATMVTLQTLESLTDRQIPGRRTLPTPSMTFFDDDTTHTKWNGLAPQTPGFMVRMPYGDVQGRPCEVWPCKVNTRNRTTPATGTASQFVATFGITSTPNQSATIPAP